MMKMTDEVSITKNRDSKTLRKNLGAFLEEHRSLLPASGGGRILLKPNFNSNMNALTGNTTDLRLITAIIELLSARGYRNIVIGEGTNSGFYRNRIDVASRLKVKRLVQKLGVEFLDLNYSRGRSMQFVNGDHGQIAEECMEADLFINLPKLKMHHEVGVSVCLKNMMGCLVGQANKKKVHQSLARNILRLNEWLKPHLHIVDGLIAMEGNGPSDGLPARMDTVIAGTDPYLVDMVCAEIVGVPYRGVSYLRLADDLGWLGPERKSALARIDLAPFKRKLLRPDPSALARLVCHPRLQSAFQRVRHAPGIYELCNTRFMGRLFLKTGIRQEVFLEEEMDIRGMGIAIDQCPPGCGKCEAYCPLGLQVRELLKRQDFTECIQCLYCYMVCPERAIGLKGDFGFLQAQIDKYDRRIRQVS